MSITMLVPKQLVWTKSSGPAIERSTWLSAAKCTTASWPAIASSSVAGIADVALHEPVARVVVDVAQGREVAGVRQRVVDRDLVVGVREHVADVVRPDETGAAGDEDLHGRCSTAALLQVVLGVVAEHQAAWPAGRRCERTTSTSRPSSESWMRCTPMMRLRSSTTECSISASTELAVGRRSTCTARRRCRRGGCPAPMIAGPRTVESLELGARPRSRRALRRAMSSSTRAVDPRRDACRARAGCTRAAGPSCRCRSTSP